MATFKSISHARKSMTFAKNKIEQMLAQDLEPVEDRHRTLDLWFNTVGRLPEYADRKTRLQALEKDVMDAEIYLLYAKSTVIQKKSLLDTYS